VVAAREAAAGPVVLEDVGDAAVLDAAVPVAVAADLAAVVVDEVAQAVDARVARVARATEKGETAVEETVAATAEASSLRT
jgi:hypothetical protein